MCRRSAPARPRRAHLLPYALGLVLALGACRHAPAPSSEAARGPAGVGAPEGRLPPGVRPLAYELELAIDPRQPLLGGRAAVKVAIDRPLSRFFLHGRGLAVERAELVLADGARVAGAWREVSPVGVALLELAREVPAGEATLELAWRAPIDQVSQDGAFLVAAEGERYVFTQLEATLARRVFPSFDEPAFKTPFSLVLEVPASDVALANTPVIEETAGAGSKRVRFATTPPLPTYLVAFAVGPLDVVAARDVPPNEVRRAPLPLRGVAVKGRGGKLAHGLAATSEAITVLERYFGIAMPFPKIDVVAIPGFTGAMENAGLVTFAEDLLTLDPERTPRRDLRRAFTTIAHELAHHWVGDLATMPWWDDLWLNEAFASWIEGPAVSGFAPELDAGLHRVESALHAMDLDRLVSARRIRQPVETHDDVMNAFDDITYSKGAAVLAMFERWLGAEPFRQGVHAWLDAHRYQSSTSSDFFAALSAASGRDVATPMSSFLDQVGVPLLDVRIGCEAGRAVATVTQSRELPAGSRGPRDVRWQVPWCYRRGLGSGGTRHAEGCALLTAPVQTVTLEGDGCAAWVHPNAGAKGYWRFQVEPGAWQPLVEATLGRPNREEQLSLADAIGAAFGAARLPAIEALALLAPFAASKERVVAEAPREVLETTRTRLLGPELRPRFEAWVRAIYRPSRPKVIDPAARVADARARELQAAVLEVLADVGRDEEVRRALLRAAEGYLGIGGDGALHPEKVAPDLLELALRVAADDGSLGTWEELAARLRSTNDSGLKRHLLRALGGATRPERAARARALMLELEDDELMTMLRAHTERAENAEDAWVWLKVNLDALRPRVSEEFQAGLGDGPAELCTRAGAEALRGPDGARIAALPGGPRVLAGAIESVELCAALVEAQATSARAFVEALPATNP